MSTPALRRTATAAAAVLAVVALPGCALSSNSGATGAKTVVLVTHDSWAMDKKVIAQFEKQSGYTVKVTSNGDAGALTNKLVLTKDDPIGDVVFGIDNTFASRATDAGILQGYTASHQPASSADYALAKAQGGNELTPVDYGDVCVNVDDTWYAAHHLAPPRTLDDLTRKTYRDQLVVPGPTSSSPGLAFLLTTISAKGQQGWQGYWRKLITNGVKIDAGWSDAYQVDFTGGGGKGDRPIVLSYASSPPFTIPKGATKPTTSALLDTCFRQVEYAGALKGARNSKGARAFVDFMVGKDFQKALPDQMYVFPVDKNVALPADWATWAKVATKPWTLAPAEISSHRTEWLRQWRDLASR
ncbi:MAG: thiamine ABC transporter substrate-binding protein [Actinomycetota bacterium]|nr:thiamine ABC transporter substrate-binding protein [Actinomycetota bacterium]